jgi:hypothetical protein
MDDITFVSDHMKEMDEVVAIYHSSVAEANEKRTNEIKKQYHILKHKILNVFDEVEDAISRSYDEVERAAREKCENDIVKIREKHYKRKG